MNRVIFEGYDNNGKLNLGVTDGTSAGSSEVQVVGASSSGLQPLDFTVLRDEVVFSGVDLNNRRNLWVTDGTTARTSEVQVAGLGGAPLVSSNTGLTVLGSKA